MMTSIDLNADLGESFGPWRMGDDAAMLDIVTSANIACGKHAGDPLIMARTVELARSKRVSIGAHPGFDDLQGFGRRRPIKIDAAELEALLLYQIGALEGIARAQGCQLSHVKVHGALSNMMAEDARLAHLGAKAVKQFDDGLVWVGQASTPLEHEARALGLKVAPEIFADRGYTAEGLLMPRSEPSAVIEDPALAADNVMKLIEALAPATICVHGDSPGAVRTAEHVRKRLEQEGIAVTGFNARPRS